MPDTPKPLTDAELATLGLDSLAWENDEHDVVLARDIDPTSPRYGDLLYAGRPDMFDGLNPVYSNVAMHKMDQAHRPLDRFVANRPTYTFMRGDLAGWYVHEIPGAYAQGFNRDQIAALEAATDWKREPEAKPEGVGAADPNWNVDAELAKATPAPLAPSEASAPGAQASREGRSPDPVVKAGDRVLVRCDDGVLLDGPATATADAGCYVQISLGADDNKQWGTFVGVVEVLPSEGA